VNMGCGWDVLGAKFEECVWIDFGSVGLRQGSELAPIPNMM